MVNSGFGGRRRGSDALAEPAAAGARFLGDLAGEAGSSPERLRSSRRHGTPRVRSSREGFRPRGGYPSPPRAGVAWWRSGGGGGRQSSRSAVPNVNLVGRASRGEGRGARRRASRAKTGGIGRGRPRRTGDRCLRATVSPRAPEASSPSGSAPAPSSASDASSRDTSAAFRPDVSRPRTSALHAAAPRSSSRPSSSSSKCRLALEVLDARGCAPKSPHSAKLQPPSRFPLEERGKCLSSQIIMCDIPFGVSFLSEGGEFNNSHRKAVPETVRLSITNCERY